MRKRRVLAAVTTSATTTGQYPAPRPVLSDQARRAMSKVPEVTAYFWITKVLTTGMGETASDFLTRVFGNIPAVGLGRVWCCDLVVRFQPAVGMDAGRTLM